MANIDEYVGIFTGPEFDRMFTRIGSMADQAEQIATDTARTVAREVGASAAAAKINEYIPTLDKKVTAAETARTGAESARAGAEAAKAAAAATNTEVQKTASDIMYSLLHVQAAPPLQYLDEAIILVSPTMAML